MQPMNGGKGYQLYMLSDFVAQASSKATRRQMARGW